MLDKTAPVAGNVLLSAVRPADASDLIQSMSLVTLPVGFVVEELHQDIEHVFFPEDGVLSVEGTTSRGLSLQIAMIGREGRLE